MTNYDSKQWLIFNYINGAGGKFLINCFFQFDQVANWYALGLSKKQRADRYLTLLNSTSDVWKHTEPDHPWALTFFSRTYPREHNMPIDVWNHAVDKQASAYFKECWAKNQTIADFWHYGYRPTFWSNAKWITIRIDDMDLYKSLLLTKVYDYNKHTGVVINQMENPSTGSLSNQQYKKQFQNPWYWENVSNIDKFVSTEIASKPWYQSWQNVTEYDKDNTIDLSHLFDLNKLCNFLEKYESVFNESLDFATIKDMHSTWVQKTELKSKNVL